MDRSETIRVANLKNIIQAIPESLATDTVTIEIRRLSDSYTWSFSTLAFASGSNSGSMIFVNDIVWKQSFTPPAVGTYIIVINNSTLGVKYVQSFEATLDPTVTVAPVSGTTAADMLTAVNNAIITRLNGGAVQSYSVAGRNIQKATLEELYRIRDRLTREVNSASDSGFNFATFNDPE